MLKEIGIEELKQIQLGILKRVATFCDKNNITYFLAYGTLLGAIRHKGYIPWDDDIDISLPRPDFERFVATFNDMNEELEVLSWGNNANWNIPFAKVHDKRTSMRENTRVPLDIGVNIDVFPIDGLSNDRNTATMLVRRILFYSNIRCYKSVKLSSSRSFFRNVLVLGTRIVCMPFSNHYLLNKINVLAASYKFNDSQLVGHILYPASVGEIIEKNVFEESQLILFEGHMFRIPIGYDKWLTQIYGDYMQYPPLEQQVSHHVFKAYWKK